MGVHTDSISAIQQLIRFFLLLILETKMRVQSDGTLGIQILQEGLCFS
jgi:hypothetical protein